MYIVALGDSAGGMEAIWEFFAHLPTKLDVSFVVVQHLDWHHKSISNKLLAKHTSLPIYWARQAQPLRAKYLSTTPNKLMTITKGSLGLTIRRMEDRHNWVKMKIARCLHRGIWLRNLCFAASCGELDPVPLIFTSAE